MGGAASMGRGALAVVVGASLLFSGCANTMTGVQQSCRSSKGLLSDPEMSCTGSVDTIKGSPILSVADVDEEFSGDFRLDLTMQVGEGDLRATVTNTDGEEVGGELGPGEPLEISETVALGSSDEEMRVSLDVLGGEEAEAADLTYTSRLTPVE